MWTWPSLGGSALVVARRRLLDQQDGPEPSCCQFQQAQALARSAIGGEDLRPEHKPPVAG